MSKIHGKNGAIYIDGNKVSFKTEWDLNLSREYADVTPLIMDFISPYLIEDSL